MYRYLRKVAPDTSFVKLGNALNDQQFDFKSRRLSHAAEYRLIEC